MPTPDPLIDPRTGRPWTPVQRGLRAIARRLPRTAAAFHWTVAKTRHYLGRIWYRLCAVPRTWRWAGRVLSQIARRRRESRPTIAIDVTPLWESLTGVGWYLYRILEQVADNDELAIRLYGPDPLIGPGVPEPVEPLPQGRAIEHVVNRVPADLLLAPGTLMRWLQALESVLIALDGNRVLFAPNYFLPRKFWLARGRRVATVHDLGLHHVSETLQDETREALERNLRRSASRATRLISVSRAVRDELVSFGYATADKIDPIHHGPGQLAAVAATSLPAGVTLPYALHVGTLEPRKNILGLLAGWGALLDLVPDAGKLLLCGRYGWKADAIREEVERAEAEGWVRLLGYVDEGELAALYQQATVVVFPTLYEGFGLPAVEAQLAGAPLVCSDIPVLREVAGDGAAYVAAGDPNQLARTLSNLLTDSAERAALAERGRANAANFSWRRAADATIATWRRAGSFGEGS